jgi:isopentenyl-diphosphate delta-isomerase
VEPSISRRKADHLALAASGQADFRAATLLEEVHLIHQALPEIAADQIDLSTSLLGRRLRLPLVITGMTGGTAEAGAINRDLARAAQAAGVAFGVGSQRAMALHPELEATFQVRDVAPDVFLIGNLGVIQARELGPDRVADLCGRIGADALAIHLNPAQEMIQDDGDRDFRGALDAIAGLRAALTIPLLVKETGCGTSREVAAALAAAGVRALDVSGAGGTSWVAVEAQRAAPGSTARALGEELWDWGIPTAAAVAAAATTGLEIVASGGLRSGHHVARALALGARAGGIAAPALRAQRAGGEAAIAALLAGFERSLRTICLLTGTRRVADLARAPRHLGPNLRTWIDDLGAR